MKPLKFQLAKLGDHCEVGRSTLSKEEISHKVATNAIFLAAIVNTVIKGSFVIFMSNNKTRKNILLVLSIFLLTGIFVIVFNEFVKTI